MANSEFPKVSMTFDDTRFEKAFAELYLNEGNLSDDAHDAGGKTIFGITSRDFPLEYKICAELWQNNKKNLALDYAKKFYRRVFWNPLYDFIREGEFAFRLFDLSVNNGTKSAILSLQRFLNLNATESLIAVDGVFGKQTLNKLNALSDANEVFYDKFIEYQKSRFKRFRGFVYFGNGWFRRLARKVAMRDLPYA